MRRANPIYDVAFKYLMKDRKSAAGAKVFRPYGSCAIINRYESRKQPVRSIGQEAPETQFARQLKEEMT